MSRLIVNRAFQRQFSTGANIQRTPEQIKAGLEKVEKLKLFNQQKSKNIEIDFSLAYFYS